MRNYFVFFALISLLAMQFQSCKENDEVLPVLNLPDSVFFQEGTSTQLKALVTIQLTASASKDVTLGWTTLDGTAKAGIDYVAQTDVTTMIPKGSQEITLEITLINDDIFEQDNVFSIMVTSLENAVLGNESCKITIQNDDAFVPELLLDARFLKTEGASGQGYFQVPVKISGVADAEISFKWSTTPGWAKVNEDFVPVNTTQEVFIPGETKKMLQVTIINDDIFEMDDYFDIVLEDIQGAEFTNTSIRVYIENDDNYQPELVSDGYITPNSWPGMQLVWSDEFEGSLVNTNNWSHELGGGGWGNSEWQIYTNSTTNSYLSQGKLNIVATKVGSSYYSARLITKGKKEFTFGRIDIRARMPYGKGIWPALWTLGSNISQVGWPRCGEIDIMEYLGHIQSQVHGTIHYYDAVHKSLTSSYTLSSGQSFHDAFHVFSIVWQENTIKWYVDYELFYQVKDTQAPFDSFRLPQFFIFNLAVGGVWPGYPDETTVFPQTLLVDYVRVFQVE